MFDIQKYVEDRKAVLLANRDHRVKVAKAEDDINDAFIAYIAAVGELDLLLEASEQTNNQDS